MNKMHVKKGDTVEILSGDYKGKSALVLRAFPKSGMVLVEGVGMVKRHQKSLKKDSKGQIIEKTMPIRASKVRVKGEKKAKPAAKAPAKKAAAK